MPKLQAFWIHGSSAQTYREGYFISKVRDGGGSIFRTHGTEWFFFQIPTPVIVDDQRSSLVKLFVLYKTVGTARITAVHADDGNHKIKIFDKLDLSGEHQAAVDNQNSWVVSPAIPMRFGLNLGVLVDFGPPTKVGVPEILFAAASAEFQTP